MIDLSLTAAFVTVFATIAGSLLSVVVSYGLVDTWLHRDHWRPGRWWSAMAVMGAIALGNGWALAHVMAGWW